LLLRGVGRETEQNLEVERQELAGRGRRERCGQGKQLALATEPRVPEAMEALQRGGQGRSLAVHQKRGGNEAWTEILGRGVKLKSLDFILEALGSHGGHLSRGAFLF
jgi:hypothetical protein